MAEKPSQKTKFGLNSRAGNALVVLVAFAAAYALTLRAIDTGSLQQYSLVILFFTLAVYCAVRAVRNK